MRHLKTLLAGAVVLAALSAAPDARSQDASEIIVRLGRIEAENRRLIGRVEELEQQNRRLEEQLKRFQEDVEFRLGNAPKPGDRPSPRVAAPGAIVIPAPAAPPATPGAPLRRSDAFDPTAAPAAPGAPRPLGATPPSAPLAATAAPPRPAPTVPPRPVGAPLALPGATPGVPAGAPAAPAPVAAPVAVSPSGDARTDFDVAFGFMQRNEHEAAELALRQFLDNHPKSSLRASATYWLGESFYRRNMHREAAEQFLKVSTDHAKSVNAPQGMLRLGQSLAAIGAKDQACATLREIDKRYPQTSAAFKKDVERESKRAKCEAA